MLDVNREEVVKIIKKAFQEVGDKSNINLPENIDEKMRILGGNSPFDSMHVVNIIVIIEEYIADTFDLNITLANEHTMSQGKSPFLSISTLTDYIVGNLL
ncbi:MULTISPECIES: hypothetical protein [Aphanizomenonaceae]|jgi:hypothetical protein|uniref:Carrier domain-containing protein n=1 Tax=Dolichospermum heterosporum TAC447 TaxID=747523 RepID=A0ABY5LQY5_9CYAN|nr:MULTISPECIES: hypothetical protein [Aphanizomenonaceae]MTJ28992.1 hypothetical protein [Aphanizomenon sp. UHCC 0183]QSV69427.1 MAG: hypothetical protein HEQ20_00125 [Aphanizomenon flos-aquae KM1D3_PB]UUO13224.1 hypothetical protein NG743_14035 [Dolichospermum heterosporum TAC447]